MSLTPVNNGDSGAVARGKINTSFAQVDTNTTAIAAKQPLDSDKYKPNSPVSRSSSVRRSL